MGLWKDLFKRAARDKGALLAPGRSYPAAKGPSFPNLGQAALVANDKPLRLSSIVNAGKPTVALIYSNC